MLPILLSMVFSFFVPFVFFISCAFSFFAFVSDAAVLNVGVFAFVFLSGGALNVVVFVFVSGFCIFSSDAGFREVFS